MADFNYRFSIIPAPAVTDKDLSANAFRVLCLLGRHTNDAGWCSRSQVKMARELGVGRATIQDALEILYERGYVERRANGRGSRAAPIDGEQPFSAHSYRVKLDRDDLPGRIKDAIGDEGGAATAAGGAAPPAGGAAPPAPLEGISSEGISSEPERESPRAREEMPVAKFLKRWPTAAVDDHTKITKHWQALSADQQHAAIDGIDAFLAKLKAQGRKHIIAGWKYLEERRWTLIDDDAPNISGKVEIRTWTREWWAALFDRIRAGESTAFMVRYAMERSDQRMWLVDASACLRIDALTAYAANGPEIASWRPWFKARGIDFPVWERRFSVFLPSPSPDALATEDDLNHFAKTG